MYPGEGELTLALICLFFCCLIAALGVVGLVFGGCMHEYLYLGDTVDDETVDMCIRADAKIKSMNCLDRHGKPMAVYQGSVPFWRACENAWYSKNKFVDLYCVLDAETCGQIRRCKIVEFD